MNLLSDKKKIMYISLLIALVGLTTVTVSDTKTAITADAPKTQWEKVFEKQGAKQAYTLFKKKNNAVEEFGKQHSNAHVIGEILYDQEGIEGLAICDKSFTFGCYHSFFIKAIGEHGTGIIPELDSICIEEYGRDGAAGCQHGIGHGIMQYMGTRNLTQALDACTQTTQLNKRSGCPAGLFMEYNLPVTFTPESIRMDIRKMDKNNPYAPCNTVVSEDFKESCYFQLPEWWSHIYRNTNNRTMATITELCSNIEKEMFRDSCYLASGNVASFSSDYQIDTVLNKCKQSPEKEGEILCRIGASHRLSSIENTKKDRQSLCEGIETYKTYTCYTN